MTFDKSIKLSLSFIFIFFIFIFFIIYNRQRQEKEFFDNNYIIFDKQKELDDLQKIIDATTAKGVVVYDLKNDKILGQKNVNTVYSLASITKIITAYLVYEKDRNKLDEIREMMKTSNNEDAERLTDIFSDNVVNKIDYINNKIKKYELYIRNVSGLDIILDDKDNRLAGGEGKPMSIIYFIKDYYIKYPEIFDQTLIEKNNTNILVKDLKFLSGGKTGFTNLSGGNLFVSIQKGLGREIFILVLSSTEKNRFVDVQNIADFLIQSSI